MTSDWPRDGPKMAPGGPKRGSGWAQKSLNYLRKINIFAYEEHSDTKIAQDGAKLAPRCPRSPGRPQKWPQEAPKRPQDGPEVAPGSPQDGPNRPQDGPKMAPRWHKMAQGGPKMAPSWPQENPK